MTYDVSSPAKWTPFFIVLFASGHLRVGCTICSDTANNFSIPVARFCTDDTVSGSPVVLDGFYADGLHEITTCKCVTHASKNDVTFTFKNAYDVSPIHNVSDCGSTVRFSQSNTQEKSKSCRIDGIITMNTAHGDLDMYLIRDTANGNRSYCFKLYVDSGYTVTVSCINAIRDISVTSTSLTTSDAPVLLTSEITSFYSTLEKNDDLIDSTTETQTTISPLSNSSIQDTRQLSTEQDHNILFIVIGCVVVLVCIFVVGIILFLKFRNKSKETQTTYDDLNVHDNNSTSHYNSLSMLSDTCTEKHQYENSQTDSYITANGVENSYYEMDFNNKTPNNSNVSKVGKYGNQNKLK